MVCTYCMNETQVTNSRHQKRANNVWRRRHCSSCDITFTTHEKADLATSSVVLKQSGALEPLSRDKLFISIYESCRHRATALPDAAALTDTVLGNILKQQSTKGSILLDDLLDTTQRALHHFDPVSATYYQAYFRKN